MTAVLATPTTPSVAGVRQLPAGWWARGLALAERCALSALPAPATTEWAERRLARWRKEHQLDESGQFGRRLAAAGLAEEQLLALLAENPAELAARAGTPPEWAALTEAVLARMPDTRPAPEPDLPDEEAWRAGLATVLAPFPELAVERLDAVVRAERLDALVDSDALRRCFVSALSSNLVTLASRTLVLELNVLRVTDRLAGDTPRARFWSFVRHFTGRARLASLLAEYPVMARLLAQATGNAVDNWLELLRRFARDRAGLVEKLFGGADPGPLVEVATGQGDSHQRGRAVALLRFAGGPRLVYKPRPLAAHVHFNRCVDWLNARVPGLGLRTLAVVDEGRYGWVEFAEHRPCADRSELRRYYRRQGALLGLLYALDGADFHFENLIASGDQPVLVDLEALFHPRPPQAGPELLAGDPARTALENSVARVGLLPHLIFGDDGTVLDLGGGGGDAGATMPFKVATWDGAGTDQMRLVRDSPAFPGSQNRPRLGDADADPSEFVAELAAGFGAAYEAIRTDRGTLADRLLPWFRDVELRFVSRATRIYAVLLYESTHPDVLRDALDRDRILDLLWAMSRDDPFRERLVVAEQADLWAGDVPFFAVRAGGREMWTSTGDRLPDALAAASLDQAFVKLGQLSARDREVQEWMIQATFASRIASTAGRVAPASAGGAAPAPVTVPPEQLASRAVDAARAIGDRLADTAYRDGERVGWLGLTFVSDSRWQVQQLGYDLYSGYAGVALFLSQLADLTGEQRYADLARDAIAPLRSLPDDLTDSTLAASQGGGAFSAVTGMAYALVHVAANLAEPELLAPVEPLLAAVARTVPVDTTLDVIGGSAGGLVAALAVHQATGMSTARDLAEACARRLVATAQRQPRGVAWVTKLGADQPLTGFSHGAAGIGWALLRYAVATGARDGAELGLAAFEYERGHYRPDLGNWPDFRVLPGRPDPADWSGLHAWCHGSPGIGLARADSHHLTYPDVAADLDLAVRAMLAAGPEHSHCLCHGQLGNLELLTVAAANGRADLAPALAQGAVWALDGIARTGPVCGTPGGVATPGLMCGLAGIGHGLLRLGLPHRVPSVLLLRAPRGRLC